MAKSTFHHLETLPLDEENLIISTDPESNIKSKSCLNLGFIASNTLNRHENILEINQQAIENSNPNTFLSVSYILENYLITLLNINTISNIENTDITEHFRRRKITIQQSKILPSFKYCQDLLYSNFKIWGGLYGTLLYYINLREEYNEYYTPSEQVYYSSLHQMSYIVQQSYQQYLNTSFNSYKLISSSFEELINTLNNETSEADKEIYDFSKNILITAPALSNVLKNLRFYEVWLPKVYNWYIRVVESGSFGIKENPSTNKERANNTLTRLSNLVSSEGLDEKSFNKLFSSFVRQTIDPGMFDFLDEIILIRKQSTYLEIDTEVALSEEELLVDEFHKTISILDTASSYREASNLILHSFSPPGGYSLLQVTLACNLINRAYILTFKERNNNTLIQNTNLYRRIIRLLGFASILLIKTNKKHIQSIGINLLKSFNINLTNIQPNNLLDL